MDAKLQRRNLMAASAAAGLVLVADRLSKNWAWDHLRGSAPKKIIPDWLHLDFAFNPGSAFGVGASLPWATELFSSLAVLVIAGLFILMWRLRPRSGLASLGVGLSAGGAAGNLLDRLTRVFEVRYYGLDELSFRDLLEHGPVIAETLREGRHWFQLPREGVVDFIIVFYAPLRRWPAFNVADLALTLGALSLIAWVWREDATVFSRSPRTQTNADTATPR